MLNLRELQRAAALLDAELAGARVERIAQVEPRSVVLTVHAGPAGTAHVLLCAEPRLARLSRVDRKPAQPPKPPAFAQLLRARIGSARLAGVSILGGDRQALLRFEGGESYALLLALLGPRTNLYLLDAEQRVVGSLRPLAETRAELALGEPYRPPPSRPPRADADRFDDAPDDAFFAAIERAVAERAGAGEEDALRRRIAKALERGGRSVRRKREGLERDARAGEEAEVLQRQGELLKGALGSVRPGDAEVRARDFESGEEVVVALDPTRTPKANLEDFFRRAKKARRRADRAVREIGVAEDRERDHAALAAEFEAIGAGEGALDELRAFASRPEVQRLVERFAPESRPQPTPAAKTAATPRAFRLGNRELPRRLWPRRYRTSDDLEVWVGRSDEANDVLTTKLARGRDLFLHVSASPGTHVILRTEGRTDPPSESLLEACEVAVHFSKQRNASRAEIHVVPIKNVSKPKGAKPGLVYVTGGKTLHLRRDPKRLERILGARVED